MAVPDIEIRTSLQVAQVGVAFSFQPAALNVPTSWTALYLPTGLAINGSTGAITGTPTTVGYWQTVLAATNADGTDRVVLLIPVLPAVVVDPKDPFDLYLDLDSSSLLVTLPGQAPPEEGQPLFYAPQGTNRNLYIGVLVDGDYADCDPDEDGLTIRMGLKELETERLIELTTGDPEMVELSNDVIRYRQAFRINPANWTGVLLDYEDDGGTMVSALAEIQVTRGAVSTLYDTTLTDSSIAIEGGITTPTTGNHDFGSLASFAVATPMRLTLTLNVAGRVLQTVSLVRTFDLIFSGGAFVLSNLSGATTGQGAVEGGNWRATLNLTSLTGDSNSVLAAYSITTTTGMYAWEFGIAAFGFAGDLTGAGSVTFATGPYLALYDASETMIGSATQLDASYDDAADFFAGVMAAWDAIDGAATAHSVEALSSNTFRIWVLAATDARHAGLDSDSTPPADPPVYDAEGATTCSVVGQLEQLEDPTAVPLNLTSRQFRIGIPRDIVPDPS